MKSRVSTATKMSSKKNGTHSIRFSISIYVVIVCIFRNMMATFTKQSGYPVLNVKKVSRTEYQLTQKRFFSNPANENTPTNDSEFRYRWIIPLTYVIDSNATVQTKLLPIGDLICNATMNAFPPTPSLIVSRFHLQQL